jgi:hypothetical protein
VGESGGDSEGTRDGSDVLVGRSDPAEGDGRRWFKWKKCLFLPDWRGKGLPKESGEAGPGEPGRMAVPGRIPAAKSKALNAFLSFGLLSSTSPAVLGLASSSNVILKDGRAILDDGGLGALPLMTEERLFDTECPRIVDKELSVSEEMVDSGRMYSTRSEKPTRALEGGLRGEPPASSCVLEPSSVIGEDCRVG